MIYEVEEKVPSYTKKPPGIGSAAGLVWLRVLREAQVRSSFFSISGAVPILAAWQTRCLPPSPPHLPPGRRHANAAADAGARAGALWGHGRNGARGKRNVPCFWLSWRGCHQLGVVRPQKPPHGKVSQPFRLPKRMHCFFWIGAEMRWCSWHLPAPSSLPAGKRSSLQRKTCGETTWMARGSVPCPYRGSALALSSSLQPILSGPGTGQSTASGHRPLSFPAYQNSKEPGQRFIPLNLLGCLGPSSLQLNTLVRKRGVWAF